VAVIDLAVDGNGILAGYDRLLESPQFSQGASEVAPRCTLAMAVAGLAEDGNGILAGRVRLLKPPYLAQDVAEVGERRTLAVWRSPVSR
jgi:hypothetical protein